jgi:hypothetical protein
MRNYDEPAEYVLRRVWFEYQGTRYEGRGVLTWDPANGYHLEAPVEPIGGPARHSYVDYVGVFRPKHHRPIRMELDSGGWARARRVVLANRRDLRDQARLSIDFDRVLFCTPLPSTRPAGYERGGRALYSVGEDLKGRMSDKVDEVVVLGGQRWGRQTWRSGIRYVTTGGQRAVGRVLPGGHLELYYGVDAAAGATGAVRRWAQAFADALSILSESRVRLLYSEFYQGDCLFREIRRKEKALSFGWLAPIKMGGQIDRDTLIRLSNFLATREPGAYIARAMLDQLEAAALQKYWQARELLLGTILEAVVRTLNQNPYREVRYKKLKLEKELDQFRNSYLSSEWEEACRRAFKVQKRLRDANAHPDWLYEERKALSHDSLQQAHEDAIFLARFYGAMMLALARIPSLSPDLLKV